MLIKPRSPGLPRRYGRYTAISYRRHATKPEWVPESVVEDQIVAMLAKLAFPKEVYDWAIASLRHTLAKDATGTETELRKLTKKAADVQAGYRSKSSPRTATILPNRGEWT